MSRLAVAAETQVLGVDYRLMPQADFDEILQDAVTAFDYLLQKGYSADKIVLSGDSAGGHLCMSLALRLKQLGKGQVGQRLRTPLIGYACLRYLLIIACAFRPRAGAVSASCLPAPIVFR